jgi:citrate lyase subunit beta/citryl-CoA lyase
MATMILRSSLFIPGHRVRFYERAREFAPDGVILDLEDAVPIAEKPAARQVIRERLGGPLLAGLSVFVRVNAIDTPFFLDDIRGVVATGLDGIFLPKVESAEQIREAHMALAAVEVRAGLRVGAVRVIPIVETVKAVLCVHEIAGDMPRVLAVAFGAEDFSLDLGVERSSDGLETRYPRARVALAAHAAGVLAIDTPWSNIADPAGLLRETREARQLGFAGKQAIHPSQVATINEVFTPLEADLANARRVVEAYDRAVERGEGAIQLDGKLIDVPMVERARHLLVLAERLGRRGEAST